ncbi:hypothetical protein T440DRAFT_505839 [Plenodomus tracheiphilus IPT5]|uniref:RING-type domain-containing protein n=1 Tax=Plenodomus tracheiphilus IPT5 TaxID=1408161 RepID=A0A6A7BDQ8_9PLEO|nr:hypothetical protein T440DRAFT_505839 [Plenodomus tracheiphilus IPT5]
MANDTAAKGPTHKPSTLIIAIAVPLLMVIALIALITLNRRRPSLFSHPHPPSEPTPTPPQNPRKQTRQDELNHAIQTQYFHDWIAAQKEQKKPESLQSTESDILCTICLDAFEPTAQIRGLQCSHAFHAVCLDEWFARFHEFCPLCHGVIVPRGKRRKGMSGSESEREGERESSGVGVWMGGMVV